MMNEMQSTPASSYIRSIEPESRHPEIFNISRESQIYIEEIFQLNNSSSPTKVLISRGLSNSLELNIGLFHAKQARYEVFQLDMRQPRQVRCVID
jgi:hypothetical protein